MNELGQMLREARESQGISLAEAEAQTRIRQKFIAAMEAEEWSLLPNDVTTRGFLRKYAGYLGLDEETVVQRFQSRENSAAPLPALSTPPDREVDYRPIEMDLSSPPRRSLPWGWIGAALVVLLLVGAAPIEMDLSSPPRRSLPWGWIGAALVVLLLVGAALAIYFFQPNWISNLLALPRSLPNPADIVAVEPTASQNPTATVEINRITATPTAAPATTPTPTPTPIIATVAATATAELTPTVDAPASQPVERIALGVAILARSWVRVVVDNSVALEAVLEAGELRSWEAAESIVLRTGNAAGVQATVNGQTLAPLGGTSEVIEVQWRLVDGQIVQSTPTPLPATSPATASPEPAAEDTPAP